MLDTRLKTKNSSNPLKLFLTGSINIKNQQHEKNKQQIFNHNENLKLTRSFIRYRKANLNNFNFPLKGGYLIAGSNHVGV